MKQYSISCSYVHSNNKCSYFFTNIALLFFLLRKPILYKLRPLTRALPSMFAQTTLLRPAMTSNAVWPNASTPFAANDTIYVNLQEVPAAAAVVSWSSSQRSNIQPKDETAPRAHLSTTGTTSSRECYGSQ